MHNVDLQQLYCFIYYYKWCTSGLNIQYNTINIIVKYKTL